MNKAHASKFPLLPIGSEPKSSNNVGNTSKTTHDKGKVTVFHAKTNEQKFTPFVSSKEATISLDERAVTSSTIKNSISKSSQTKTAETTSSENQNRAAVILQKHARRFLQCKGVLSTNKTPEYKQLCADDTLRKRETIHRLAGGSIPVFCSEDFPEIVIKYVKTAADARMRLDKTRDATKVINGQNISHLIVPKAIILEGKLVEDRLLVCTDIYHNMGLYIDNQDLFNEPVREMVRFSSRLRIADLISRCNPCQPLSNIHGVNYSIRHDNMPLYIVEVNGVKEGRIGLIDLEHLSERNDSKSLKELVLMFPYHVGIIKEEAYKCDMEYDAAELDADAALGEKRLKLAYTDHYDFIQQQENTSKVKSLEINDRRIEELEALVAEKITKLNKGEGYESKETMYRGYGCAIVSFLNEDISDVVSKAAKGIVPIIIQNINELISDRLTNPVSDDPVALRSMFVKKGTRL